MTPGSEHDRIEKMYVDLYLGDGKDNPSITARLFLVEAAVEKIGANINKGIWLLLGIFIEIAANLYVSLKPH